MTPAFIPAFVRISGIEVPVWAIASIHPPARGLGTVVRLLNGEQLISGASQEELKETIRGACAAANPPPPAEPATRKRSPKS
jgi:hypothetical protein